MHHYPNLLLQLAPKKELTQVYISMIFRNFALSLLCLFVPLYLYHELGYSLAQTLYFFIFYALIFAISTPFTAKFCSRYGVKHSVLISVPFYLAFVLGLYLLPTYPVPLWIIASMLSLAISFYWMGMHIIFYHASHKKKRGEEVGKRAGWSILATMLGPLIGGFLIKFVGFWAVFLLTAGVLLGSAIVLFFSQEKKINYHFQIRSLIDKKHWKDSLFFVSRGSRVMAEDVVWPLFIFAILNDYLSLGLMGFVLSGVSAILIFSVGKYSDHASKRKILRGVTIFESIAWFLRAFVTTVSHVFAATVLGALTFGIREAPMSALEYDKARDDPPSYFVTREIFICLGRILLLIFVLITDSLTSGLILQGFLNLAGFLF